MLKIIKSYMMPISMTVGAIFYRFFDGLSFLTPFLIFVMLFLTYCKLDFRKMRVSPLHGWLIAIQLLGSLGVYLLLAPVNTTLAQGALICVLAPTATSAPVITGMLRGNVASLTTYSLLSNLCLLLGAPFIFSLVGKPTELSFIASVAAIGQKVVLLLVSPFVLALLLRKTAPAVTTAVGKISGLSFYLWSVALCVVTGRTVQFIVNQNTGSHYIEVLIAVAAFILCVVQFFTGKTIGKRYGETIAGGQALGQKNTILAIWMAQMYLSPIASIAPGAYVLWQNIFNSWQIWREARRPGK